MDPVSEMQEQKAPRARSYRTVYKWTVLGLWLIQLIILVPDLFHERGTHPYTSQQTYIEKLNGVPAQTGYYERSTGLDQKVFQETLEFLILGAGETLASSLLLGLVWAYAIWRILGIGQPRAPRVKRRRWWWPW